MKLTEKLKDKNFLKFVTQLLTYIFYFGQAGIRLSQSTTN